jgi:putative addiction module component (TIGR02574 family)
MAHAVPMPPPGFDNLSVDEQVEYVQSLWERISARPEEVAVPDWHRAAIRERLAQLDATPQAGRPWSEVRDDLLRKLRGNRR